MNSAVQSMMVFNVHHAFCVPSDGVANVMFVWVTGTINVAIGRYNGMPDLLPCWAQGLTFLKTVLLHLKNLFSLRVWQPVCPVVRIFKSVSLQEPAAACGIHVVFCPTHHWFIVLALDGCALAESSGSPVLLFNPL